jgi:hypothetical protein
MKVYMVMVTSADCGWSGIDYINSETVCVGVYDSLEAAQRTEAEFMVVLDKVRESVPIVDVSIEEKELNETISFASWARQGLVWFPATAAEFMEGEQA